MPEIYVALLRGINVGRAKRVAMADLRALVADLGYGHVRTLLNSGNVLCTGPAEDPTALAAAIEKEVAARLGVSARVLVLTAPTIAEAVAENTLRSIADNPSRLLVAFFAAAGDARRVEALTVQNWAPEVLAVGTSAAYLWCPDGVLASRLPAAVQRAATDAVTTRNWSTVMKLNVLSEELRKTLEDATR
ncbi:MAG: DUF1697 domain-containing protein [Acidobacteriota bacterium]